MRRGGTGDCLGCGDIDACVDCGDTGGKDTVRTGVSGCDAIVGDDVFVVSSLFTRYLSTYDFH